MTSDVAGGRVPVRWTYEIATDKWPFYDHIWAFICQLYVYLPQNWGSEGFLRCLTSWYKSYDIKCKNTENANKCFCTKSQKNRNGNICSLNQSEFRPVKHLKMTVWTAILWKMHIHMANKWPEMVIKWSFMRDIHFESVFNEAREKIS